MAGLFVFASTSPTTEPSFAGWAVQAEQRTVAGCWTTRCRRCSARRCGCVAAGRTDTGVHATGQVAHVDVPVGAVARLAARGIGRPKRVPAAGAPTWRGSCPRTFGCVEINRAARGIRCAVLGASPPLRLPGVDRPVRRRAADCALRDGVAAPARRRRDGRARRKTWSDCMTSPLFAVKRVGATTIRDLQRLDWDRDGELRHRARQRRRVLLVDGAITGGCVAGCRRRASQRRTAWCATLLTSTQALE